MSDFKNIFDAHAHYDDEWYDIDRDAALCEINENGVCGIVCASVDIKSSKAILELSHKYDFIYAAVGIHPENLEGLEDDYIEKLEKLYSDEKAVAIGETGLDYHWDIPRAIQHEVFERQLELANALDSPVVIHDREAHGDTLETLKKYRPKKPLLHCFSGSVEFMREIMRLGSYISLGGTVTFKNARHSLEVAREVPIERLLLETDAPYLSPEPYRGKRNRSDYIVFTAKKIAELRGMTAQEILDITAENARKFYNIK